MALRQFCELIPQTFYTVRTFCHKFPYTLHLANNRSLHPEPYVLLHLHSCRSLLVLIVVYANCDMYSPIYMGS